MAKDFSHGFTFIISSMCSLANFLKDNVFKFFYALGCNIWVLTDSPCWKNDVDKVLIFLCWKACIEISIKIYESSFINWTRRSRSEPYWEFFEDCISCLISCSDSRMIGCLELTLKPINTHVALWTQYFKSILHCRKSLLIKISPKSINKLFVMNLLISIGIKSIEKCCNLLSSEEHANLRCEILELYFVERAWSINIEFL